MCNSMHFTRDQSDTLSPPTFTHHSVAAVAVSARADVRAVVVDALGVVVTRGLHALVNV